LAACRVCTTRTECPANTAYKYNMRIMHDAKHHTCIGCIACIFSTACINVLHIEPVEKDTVCIAQMTCLACMHNDIAKY
jgi:hypothetical protein